MYPKDLKLSANGFLKFSALLVGKEMEVNSRSRAQLSRNRSKISTSVCTKNPNFTYILMIHELAVAEEEKEF